MRVILSVEFVNNDKNEYLKISVKYFKMKVLLPKVAV